MRGLRLDPTSSFASQGIEIDWVRLTASNSQAPAALMTVNLNSCASFSSLMISDAAGVNYVVTDSTGNNNQREFNYGVLPPGSYSLRAVCGNGTSAASTFEINTPPAITVIDPDMTGDPGSDYAALSRGGDRWDFEQASDVASVSNVSVTAGVCGGGGCGLVPSDRPGATPGSKMLRASSTGTTPSQLGDPALEFLNGAIPPLSGTRHEVRHVLAAVAPPLRHRHRLGHAHPVGLPIVRRRQRHDADAGHAGVARLQPVTRLTSPRSPPPMAGSSTTARSAPRRRGRRAASASSASIRMSSATPPPALTSTTYRSTAPDEVALGQQFAVRYSFADPDTAGSTYESRIYIETYPQRAGRALLHTASGVSPNAYCSTSSIRSRRPCRRAATSSTPRSSKPTAGCSKSAAPMRRADRGLLHDRDQPAADARLSRAWADGAVPVHA